MRGARVIRKTPESRWDWNLVLKLSRHHVDGGERGNIPERVGQQRPSWRAGEGTLQPGWRGR